MSKEEKKEENKLSKEEMEQIKKIIDEAKKNGKMTYAELAAKLEKVNPNNIEKVFEAFQEAGAIVEDDIEDEEPDIEDLKEVERKENAAVTGNNSVKDEMCKIEHGKSFRMHTCWNV